MWIFYTSPVLSFLFNCTQNSGFQSHLTIGFNDQNSLSCEDHFEDILQVMWFWSLIGLTYFLSPPCCFLAAPALACVLSCAFDIRNQWGPRAGCGYVSLLLCCIWVTLFLVVSWEFDGIKIYHYHLFYESLFGWFDDSTFSLSLFIVGISFRDSINWTFLVGIF